MRRLFSLSIVSGAFFALIPLGCGQPLGDCQSYCEYRSKCCAAYEGCTPDKTDIPTCVKTCEDLSSDPAFASAMQKQAGCFENSTCQEIQNGDCNPKP